MDGGDICSKSTHSIAIAINNPRKLRRLLTAAAKQFQNITDMQSELLTNMRTSMSLVLRACFLHACRTASSGWEGFLLIDQFYCLRTASFWAQSHHGWKIVHFSSGGVGLIPKVLFGCIGGGGGEKLDEKCQYRLVC